MGTRPKLTRAKAIREFCLECQNYHTHSINDCQDYPCPLWEWRRGSGKMDPIFTPLRRQTTRKGYGTKTED